MINQNQNYREESKQCGNCCQALSRFTIKWSNLTIKQGRTGILVSPIKNNNNNSVFNFQSSCMVNLQLLNQNETSQTNSKTFEAIYHNK